MNVKNKAMPILLGIFLIAGSAQGQLSSAKINFRKSLELGLKNPETEIYLTRIDSIMSNSNKHPIKENDEDAPHLITRTEPAPAEGKDTSAGQIATNFPIDTAGNEEFSSTQDTISVLAEHSQPTRMSVPRAITKSYFQFGFFSLLVSLFTGWIMIVWKKRHGIVSTTSKTREPDFSAVLEKTQGQAKSSAETMDRNQDHRVNSQKNAPKKKRAIRKPAPEPLEDTVRRQQQPPAFVGDPQEKVFRYASSGYSIEEIARRLGIGKGEVELILNLNGRRSPMVTPELRFELEESLY